MSSHRWSFACAAALALVMPAPLRAQAAADSLRGILAKLARVDSQLNARENARHAEEVRTAPVRHGRVQIEGPLTLVVHENVSRSIVGRAAKEADSVLAEFGGIPLELIRSYILVEVGLSDTATLLSAAQFQHRARLPMDHWLRGDSLRQSWRFARPIAGMFRASLDSTWRAWLPEDIGLYWSGPDQAEYAINHLASESATATGKECLAGTIASCRLWLGIDDDSVPYEVRYHTEELVAALGGYFGRAETASCRQGDAGSCVRLYSRPGWKPLSPVPAPSEVLTSMVRSVRVLHGREAMRRAFADSSGSVGQRLARAAGVSEDSLVTEWRMWVLSRGRSQRVTAGMGDALSGLAFVAILVGLALRSGRWR